MVEHAGICWECPILVFFFFIYSFVLLGLGFLKKIVCIVMLLAGNMQRLCVNQTQFKSWHRNNLSYPLRGKERCRSSLGTWNISLSTSLDSVGCRKKDQKRSKLFLTEQKNVDQSGLRMVGSPHTQINKALEN